MNILSFLKLEAQNFKVNRLYSLQKKNFKVFVIVLTAIQYLKMTLLIFTLSTFTLYKVWEQSNGTTLVIKMEKKYSKKLTAQVCLKFTKNNRKFHSLESLWCCHQFSFKSSTPSIFVEKDAYHTFNKRRHPSTSP